MSTAAKYPTKKQSATNNRIDKCGGLSMPLLTTLNLLLFVVSFYFYYNPKIRIETKYIDKPSDAGGTLTQQTINKPKGYESLECSDPLWCNIDLPKISYFKFDPPTDSNKWQWAKSKAAKGDQVLLEQVRKVFPNHYDFLDGDITFRKLHYAFDFFVDEVRDLSPLKAPGKKRKLKEEITSAKVVNGKLQYPWEAEGKRVVPDPYDFRGANRSAVVSIGYTAYTRDSQTYFSGNRIGGAFIDRKTFFKHWRAVKDEIDRPFIAVCSLNENWGFISTNFPNRTAGWGQCCNTPRDREVLDFLNHDKTLLLATNQHFNLSHPKLLSLPRGIPLTWGMTRIIVWDAMRKTQNIPKNKLLFAAASSWGPRPQILRCISEKMPPEHFDGHVNTPVTNRLDRPEYYQKLGLARFGLCLPGLGYDTFRCLNLSRNVFFLITFAGHGS